jgi:hypothetical protein
MRIYLFEVIAAIDAAGTEQTFYFAYGKAYNDASAPAYYPDRIVNPINISRAISGDLRTLGSSEISAGEVVVSNADGYYDDLLNHGYGRQARLLSIDSEMEYSTAEVIFDGFVEQPSATATEISFRFRDKQEELKKSFQTVRFAGTNIGGTGLEGLESDIGGTVKPRTFGKVLNIAPVLLNNVQLIYGWNFDRAGAPLPSASVHAVRDGGLELTFGSNCASVTLLQASTPAAGYYNTCLAASMIKCGSKPAFDVTLDVTEGSTSNDNKIAHLAKRLLLDAGVDSSKIDNATVADTHAEVPYVSGFYARDEISTFEVIDQITNGAGVFVQPNGAGVYEIGAFTAPAATASITFRQAGQGSKLATDDADIISLRRVVPNDQGRGVPSWQVSLGYARNWKVQSNFAGAVAAEALERYRAAELKVTAEDVTVQTKYPQSTEISFSTLLTEQSEASAELARRAALFGTERRMFEIEAKYTPELASKLKLGATVEVVSNRYGLTAGARFVITQMDINARIQFAKITVWG